MNGLNSKTIVDAKKEGEDVLVTGSNDHENIDVDGSIQREVFSGRTASFMNLCPDVKRIILMERGLDLVSQCNLILVWKDMANVFWKSLDVERRFFEIKNVKDLVYAGVLASGGFIDRVANLTLVRADVSWIPANIVNNLVKIVWNKIFLETVSGWRISMFSDAKCMELDIRSTKLESGSDMRPFMVSNSVTLSDVSGDIRGFLDNFDVDQKKRWLDLCDIELSSVPYDLLNRFFNSFSGKISLRGRCITGLSSSMLSGINCRELHLWTGVHAALDSWIFRKERITGTLDTWCQDNARDISGILHNIESCEVLEVGKQAWNQICSSNPTDISEILTSKTKVLKMIEIENPYLFPEFLSQYNGQGKCGEMRFHSFWFDNSTIKSYKSWANARGWKYERIGNYVHLKRQQ